MTRVSLYQDELWPDYGYEISTDPTTEGVEVPLATLAKWRRAIDAYNTFLHEAEEYYERQLEEHYR